RQHSLPQGSCRPAIFSTRQPPVAGSTPIRGLTMRRLALPIGIVLLSIPARSALADELPAPKFTKKPMATRTGDNVTIAFTVDRATDVALFIENARGDIVRHLVAGVLGKNPPPPLQSDSLAQSLTWDGKADFGKPAEGGPFQV